MKKRTRIVAWVFMVIGACASLMYLSVLRQNRGEIAVAGYGRVWALQLPLWICFLKKFAWARAILIGIFSIISVVCLIESVGMISDELARRLPFLTVAAESGTMLAVLTLTGVLPLWILLTDKPSGWQKGVVETE